MLFLCLWRKKRGELRLEYFTVDISAWSAEILLLTLRWQNCKEVSSIPGSYVEKQTSMREIEIFAKASRSETWKCRRS